MSNLPSPSACFLLDPDKSYRLSAELRATVLPMFAPDVVEQLLQFTHPDFRPRFLSMFSGSLQDDEAVSLGLPDHPEVMALMSELFPGNDLPDSDV